MKYKKEVHFCQACGGAGMGCPDCEHGIIEETVRPEEEKKERIQMTRVSLKPRIIDRFEIIPKDARFRRLEHVAIIQGKLTCTASWSMSGVVSFLRFCACSKKLYVNALLGMAIIPLLLWLLHLRCDAVLRAIPNSSFARAIRMS